MTTGATGQLGLALPVQGELSGTWGDTVNNGITQYTNIAIAATLTLTNDGAVTLANTTGDASASNIVSTLTGAGTVTAQFAIVRVTGTLTTAKVVTAPSYSKTYTVVNAATGGIVTFKASGQTGVSIAVGESAFVYFNGTDYVKVAGTTSGSAGGSNTQVQYNNSGVLAGITGATTDGTSLTLVAPVLGTPASGTVTNLTGTASININGTVGATTASTGAFTTLTTSSTVTHNGGTANGVTYLNGSKVLTSGSALTYNGTSFGVGSSSYGDAGSITASIGVPGTTSGGLQLWASSAQEHYIQWGDSTVGSATYAGAISYAHASDFMRFWTASTERARVTSTGGFVVGTTTDPGNGIIADINGNVRKVPQSGSSKTSSYTLATTDIGEYILLGASGAIVIPDATFAAGDVVSIFNNTGSTATITCSITTAYIAGTFTDKATMTLAAAGVATVLFITSTLCVVSGNVT